MNYGRFINFLEFLMVTGLQTRDLSHDALFTSKHRYVGGWNKMQVRGENGRHCP